MLEYSAGFDEALLIPSLGVRGDGWLDGRMPFCKDIMCCCTEPGPVPGDARGRGAPYGCMVLRSYGGGGNAEPSPMPGESVLFLLGGRGIENAKREGIRGLDCCHGCGVKPV